MAQVTLRNLVKDYDQTPAVRGIDLDIADKEFVVLVGPSGCGKTTTLRMIAGLEDITDGEILIGGDVVNDVPPKDRDIAMVFQNYALYPHMTVHENMSFGLRLKKLPKDEIARRVAAVAGILGIRELLDRKPKQLSGGQRQRVAMGRAIVRHPKVFLFDEPLSNLDAKLRVHMRTEIKKVHQKVRTTTVYVTHDQVEAMTLADRVVVMNAGLIEQVGAPNDLYHSPATLLFGLRPEHLTEMRPHSVANQYPFEVTPEVTEPMGMETLVFFSVNGTEMCARTNPAANTQPGVRTQLLADLNHMHLIDEGSGRVL